MQATQLATAFNLFILECESRGLTPPTMDYYHWRLTPWLEWLEAQGVDRLDAIKSAHVRSYYIHLRKRGNAAHSVHAAARAIRRFCNFCVNEELLATSPAGKVAMPVLPKNKLPAFTVDEVNTLLASCECERDKAIILFLIDTGVRAAEFCALNGDDVDLDAGAVVVRLGKGRKGRVTYVGDTAREQLQRYATVEAQPVPGEPMFRSQRTNGRLTPNGLRQVLRRLSERATVDHCTPHTFRRTFALWSLRAGMALPHLQRLMGHNEITTTTRYLNLIDEDLRAAHEEFGAVERFLNA